MKLIVWGYCQIKIILITFKKTIEKYLMSKKLILNINQFWLIKYIILFVSNVIII